MGCGPDNNAGSPDRGGSGLGLTIARNLVVAHGGEIRADSRSGQGATIAFTLPITAAWNTSAHQVLRTARVSIRFASAHSGGMHGEVR